MIPGTVEERYRFNSVSRLVVPGYPFINQELNMNKSVSNLKDIRPTTWSIP